MAISASCSSVGSGMTWAQCVCRGYRGARYHRVGPARCKHQRGVIVRLLRHRVDGGVVVLLESGQALQKLVKRGVVVRLRGLYYFHAVEADVVGARDFLNLRLFAQDYRNAQLAGRELARRLEDSRVVPFREHDALGVVLQSCGKFFYEGHLGLFIKICCTIRCRAIFQKAQFKSTYYCQK